MDRGAAAAQGTAPPQDGEQPAESPEPPPPWPPPQPPPRPPAPALLHAPSPEPAPQLGPEPSPEHCPKATPEPATEFDTETVSEPDTEPAPGLAPEPATELDKEPISEPATEPALEPAPEPATEPATEPAFEPTPVPATDPAPKPVLEPAPEPAIESCPEPAPKSRTELSPAPRLLQCPVVAPERGLKTSSSPRTPVLFSSIKKILKEGPLLKNCNSFKRWKLRYFLVRGQRLCFAHHPAFARFETIDLSQVALAESSCRNLCHSFCVITPQRKVTLAAPNRKDMEEWINVIKTVQQGEIRKIPAAENNPFLTGMHYWYSSHSSRTQHCNVCRESIPALSRNVIICEVCKVKSHKLCALRASKDCKWNTLSITDDLFMPADEVTMPHQWVEGNISVSSQCAVCHENCGSYQRLQDFRCLWCNSTVHDDCRGRFSKECWFGSHRTSVIPPTALSDPKGDGQLVVSSDFWNLDWSSACSCPLLIFINSKSGDHQGIVFLRKFKQYLNPSQVFDLSKGGPEAGLCMFKNFSRFRIVVCGGDGSVSWVLSLIDTFGLHEKCQLAVIPLGTGNDLARVLGWGAFWNKNKSPITILNRVEQASVRILDRWSVMIRETPRQTPLLRGQVEMDVPRFEAAAIQHLESATTELNKILKAKYPTEMIIATRFLCSAVEDFVVDIVKAWSQIKQNNTAIESVILKVSFHSFYLPCFGRRKGRQGTISSPVSSKSELLSESRKSNKLSSRFKNKMWYGLLGSKELFHRSYRKLEERVHLECDGEAISLPNLQGIVVLNITSYAGGVNFWGSSAATAEYEAPAIDDGKLEVVAIFGSVQMAMSRIINLHHHRIAQCHEVMITIDGEEGIPVQVDGEAWIQRPGLIKIRYKNAAQMLTRDRDFENSMKMWECKHGEIQAASQPHLDSQESQDSLSDEEYAQMQHLARLAENLISRLTDLSKVHQHVSVLMDSVNASANILNDIFYSQDSGNEAGAASCIPNETLSRNDAVDVTFSLKGLYNDTKAFLDEKLLRNAEDEATLQTALETMNKELEKLSEIDWMNSILVSEEKSSDTDSRSTRMKVKFPKLGKKKLEEEDKPKSGQGVQGFIGRLWHHRSHEDKAKDDDPPT
ncbi:diacylglycerol kinase kappa [Lontra canadensis]|uniref:diacylglycerol kinase kappa n=1 Tax=Lontra canadensis TaxID=76717 RepID=UPI0013F39D53|nr:diacylglycerol kinase kappa [Lontra canadensis]